MPTYQHIILASRPRGQVLADNFRLERVPVPALEAGEVLVRNHYLSLDPYMRGRMSETKSYAPAQPLGTTMIGGTAGLVVASKNPQFAVGDPVVGMLGWSEMAVSNGSNLRKIDVSAIPMSLYLGAVGMPGMAAWYGLNHIIGPKAGETIVVSAATGAVGSVVGQLAKLKGCRVIGIAGGAEKCAYAVSHLGFDACIDYRERNVPADLAAAAPNGVDGLFENVGGPVFDATLAQMRPFGRIALCGLIAGYTGQEMPIYNLRSVLINRLAMRGFIITEHMDLWPTGLQELGALVAAGRLKYRESIVTGLDAAPDAFIGLLHGRNFGKQLVKLI